MRRAELHPGICSVQTETEIHVAGLSQIGRNFSNTLTKWSAALVLLEEKDPIVHKLLIKPIAN